MHGSNQCEIDKPLKSLENLKLLDIAVRKRKFNLVLLNPWI